MIDRRTMLSGIAAAPAVASTASATRAAAPDGIGGHLLRYAALGGKASGASGDLAVGSWLERELVAAGLVVTRQSFDVPWFEPRTATLAIGDRRADVIPQAIVVPTGPAGVTGPLVRIVPGIASGMALDGAIALIELPHGRWSSALAGPVRTAVDSALERGARAAVLVTNGPSGLGCSLNAPADRPLFARPVAVLAPRDAAPFLAGADARAVATLVVDGRGGRRPTFNLVGRRERRDAPWLVVSTPRSGWFGCAGERGPGVAVWLELARWSGAALSRHSLAFVCTSGHEYEYLGASALASAGILPPPHRTALWLHLGANLATRDWHELTKSLLPLPSADPQRYLLASSRLLPAARRAFAGQPGLEAPYDAAATTAAGELADVVAAGYPAVAGIFGAHRFHHTRGDDVRCIEPALVSAARDGCRSLLQETLA